MSIVHTREGIVMTSRVPVRPFRVAYFAGTMRPGHDGVTRVLFRLIDAVRERGIEAEFFSPIVPLPSEQDVPMHKVPSVAFPLYPDYRLALPGSKYFEQRIKDFAPNLIHINSPCPLGYAAVKYANNHGIPVVATYHTHFPSYARYYKVTALEAFSWSYLRGLYNDCDAVYVPSEPVRSELREHGLETTEFLPHGVDTSVFHPRYRDEQWRRAMGWEGKEVLLFAGRLVWEKDLKTLAEAYKIISEKRKDTQFVIAGDGPVRKELEVLMPGASFLGMLSGAELSRAYASSDLFVFPSTTETFGNVTLEAMASGVMPICAAQGGAAGFVRSGATGLLAEPRDACDLAAKIEAMLQHPEERQRMAQAALLFGKTQSWGKIFDRLFASYVAIAGKAARKIAA